MTPTRLRLSVQATIAAALLCALFACTDDDQVYLPNLKADPMAQWTPPGGTLLLENFTGYRTGGSQELQSLAKVSRTFKLPSSASVAEAQTAGLTYARSNGGWKPDASRDGTFLQRPGPQESTAQLSILASVTSPTEIVVTMTAP